MSEDFADLLKIDTERKRKKEKITSQKKKEEENIEEMSMKRRVRSFKL